MAKEKSENSEGMKERGNGGGGGALQTLRGPSRPVDGGRSCPGRDDEMRWWGSGSGRHGSVRGVGIPTGSREEGEEKKTSPWSGRTNNTNDQVSRICALSLSLSKIRSGLDFFGPPGYLGTRVGPTGRGGLLCGPSLSVSLSSLSLSPPFPRGTC